nr:MAG TPA: hypothetical protein [Caudoviricetes sp.]
MTSPEIVKLIAESHMFEAVEYDPFPVILFPFFQRSHGVALPLGCIKKRLYFEAPGTLTLFPGVKLKPDASIFPISRFPLASVGELSPASAFENMSKIRIAELKSSICGGSDKIHCGRFRFSVVPE